MHNTAYVHDEQHNICNMDGLCVGNTVKPVLITTSEKRPPVNNAPQINTSFKGGTSE